MSSELSLQIMMLGEYLHGLRFFSQLQLGLVNNIAGASATSFLCLLFVLLLLWRGSQRWRHTLFATPVRLPWCRTTRRRTSSSSSRVR